MTLRRWSEQSNRKSLDLHTQLSQRRISQLLSLMCPAQPRSMKKNNPSHSHNHSHHEQLSSTSRSNQGRTRRYKTWMIKATTRLKSTNYYPQPESPLRSRRTFSQPQISSKILHLRVLADTFLDHPQEKPSPPTPPSAQPACAPKSTSSLLHPYGYCAKPHTTRRSMR